MDRISVNIASLQRKMIKHFRSSDMQQGWELFQRRSIRHFRKMAGALAADVDHHGEAKVKLDTENFINSGCTCRENKYCRHMAAVFFYVFAQYEQRPELFLSHHLQTRLKKKRELKQREQKRVKQIADSSYRENLDETLKQSDSIERWHRFFEKKFKHFFSSSFNQVDAFYSEVTRHLSPISAQWEPSLQGLYRLHVLMFVMERTESYYRSLQSSYFPKHLQEGCEALFANCILEYEETLKKLDVQMENAVFAARLQETIGYLQHRAFGHGDIPADWMRLYLSLWWRLHKQKEYFQKEMRWLEHKKAESVLSGAPSNKPETALLHMEMISGRDEKALESIAVNGDAKEIRRVFLYLRHFLEDNDWHRLQRWLNAFTPILGSAVEDSALLEAYFEYWRLLAEHTPNEQDWDRMIMDLLPYSYDYYSQNLLKEAKYGHWVDLQLWMERSPLEVDPDQLEKLESIDVRLLLPWFHQSVEKSIGMKKREGYRIAVDFLHRLKSYYQRMDQPSSWEAYIHRLSDKYKPLRAFQEELRRSNLLL